MAKPGINGSGDVFSTQLDSGRISNMLRRAGMQTPNPGLISQYNAALAADRAALFNWGIIRSILFVALGAGYYYLHWPYQIPKRNNGKVQGVNIGQQFGSVRLWD